MPIKIAILACIFMAAAGCSRKHSSIESAVRANDAKAVRAFIQGGSDISRGVDGSDLVYLATGPEGGSAALGELLKAGASPDGLDPMSAHTPLMNAASWGSLEMCQQLIDAGADPSRINQAIKATGRAGGAEQKVLDYLRSKDPKSKDG